MDKLPARTDPPPGIPPAPALLSMQEARRQLGTISRGLLYRVIDSGELQTVRLRGRRMVVTQSLHAYVARLMQAESRG